MMRVIASNPCRDFGVSRVFRALLYSAKTRPISPREDSLNHILLASRDPNVSITPLLDQWIKEGRDIKHSELQKLIRQFRKRRRYSHALQMHEWMTGRPNYDLATGGIAVQLDLISKVHGLDKAEEYFNSIPVSSKDDKIYGAMLNCYAERKSSEKADDLFENMLSLGFVTSVLNYNVMLSLYSRTGKHEKVEALIRTMEKYGVRGDTYTLNTLLGAYAISNVEEMDKLLTKTEANSKLRVDFHGYLIAANGYLKTGLSEKALEVIKKAEPQIKRVGNGVYYVSLIRAYADAGSKEEVYRVWDGLKSSDKVYNTGYFTMISSLLKLDEIDSAEKIYEEWESEASLFDIRIENLFVTAYCKKGLADKAFDRAERITKKGHALEAGVWQCVATQYCLDGQRGKAVETMKRVVSARGAKSKLSSSTLAACLEHLKSKGDIKAAREILRLLRKFGCFSDCVCDRLVEFVNGDEASGALAAIKGEPYKTNAN